MIVLLMTLFVILCIFLALFILLQEGKGGGLGFMSGGGQTLFGGSGGQSVFEKVIWVMATIFILGSLALTIMRSRAVQLSRMEGHATTPQTQVPVKKVPTP